MYQYGGAIKFLIGAEGHSGMWARYNYGGAIGIFYTGTWHGVLAYTIVTVILVFAVIGVVSTIKHLALSRPKDDTMDPTERWLKTGKWQAVKPPKDKKD